MCDYSDRKGDTALKNEEYLDMIDKGIEQLSSGKGQLHELIEVDVDDISRYKINYTVD